MTIPPSPTSASDWRPATATLAPCCHTRARRRPRRPSTLRRMVLFRKLAEDNPTVPYRDTAADLDSNLSLVLRRLGRSADARDHAERALSQLLVKAHPETLYYRAVLADSHLNRPDLAYRALGEPPRREGSSGRRPAYSRRPRPRRGGFLLPIRGVPAPHWRAWPVRPARHAGAEEKAGGSEDGHRPLPPGDRDGLSQHQRIPPTKTPSTRSAIATTSGCS